MRNGGSAFGEKIQIRGVIFDYGNVLCHAQERSDLEGMAAICGMELERFERKYWQQRKAYDRGDLNAGTYWAPFAGDGKALSEEQIERLVALDTGSWARRNEDTIAWVAHLRSVGLPLALLSNMPLELSRNLVATGGWAPFFDHVVFSCDVRSVKPDPEIYRHCLQKLGVAAPEVLFVDDIGANVEAAGKLGMQAVIFDSFEKTLARVEERFKFPAASVRGEPRRV